MNGDLPPLPPGYKLETPSALPPLPPGYKLEAPASSAPPSSGGMADSLAGEIGGQFTTGLKKVGAAFNPFSPENRAISEQERKASIFNPGPELERGKLLASGVGGALQAASSPITGAVRTIGAPAIQAADIPMEWLTKKIFGEDVKLPPRVTHEQAADVAESLMGGIAPRGGLKGVPSVPSSPFAKPQAPGPAPSLEEIFDSSNAHYEALKDMAVPLRRRVVSDLSASAKSELEKDAFYKEDQPRTFRALDRLVNKEGDSTSKEVYAVRTALGRVIKDAPGTSDAEAAGRAIEKIDEYLSNIPEFAETSQRARKDWAAAKTSQMVQDLEQRAQRAAGASGSGANLDNAMRQQIKSLLNDKKRVGRLTADEKEVAEQLVRGGTVGNLARVLSKLGPKHPLTGWGSAIAADFAGGGGAATGSLGLGAIAQWIAEKGTTGRIRQLDELIRSRSALAREGRGEPVISPREKVQNDARSALRDKEVSLSKEDRQLLRRAARGDAPAEEMLAARKLLDRQSEPPRIQIRGKFDEPGYGGPS